MSSDKSVLKKSAFVCLRLLINIAISLFSARVVLQAMRLEEFSIDQVVVGLVSMFMLLNSALIKHCLAFFFGGKDRTQLQKTYASVLNIDFVMAVISMLIIGLVGQCAIQLFLTIPVERLAVAMHGYHYVLILFGFGIIQMLYHSQNMVDK